MATVVLLPGMDGTGTLFSPFLEALGSEFATRVLSYPGCQPYGYSELERLVVSELPSDGSIVILGESFSGPIAISLAAAHPTRIKGLILCCSFAKNPRPFFSRFKFLIGAIPFWLVPVGILSRLLLGRFASRDLRNTLAKALDQVSPSTMRARLRAVLTIDVSNKLSQLKVPALYLCASDDQVVPPTASILVQKLCPHTKLVTLTGPHLLLQSMPIEASKVVSEFVRMVDNSP